MMVDVRHRVGATVAPEKVYEALTTRDGMKQLVETGTGSPYPDEVRISNWT